MYGKRIATKSDRLSIREADFKRLVETGWQREDYLDWVIFTKNEEIRGKQAFSLKTYRGTSTNHVDYIAYRTAESRANKIAERKGWADRDAAKKALPKVKQLSSQAAAAAAIREDLKKAYPGIKFNVTSSGYSMGDHVNVKWELGPDNKEVESLIGKYQYGHFNGMEDIYESTNSRDDIPQTKHLFCSQSIPEDFTYRIAKFLSDNMTFADVPPLESKDQIHTYFPSVGYGHANTWGQMIHHYFRRWHWVTQDPEKIRLIAIHRTEEYEYEHYLEYEFEGKLYRTDVPIKAAKGEKLAKVVKMQPKAAALPVSPTAGTVSVVEVNASVIAVTGDVDKVKDKLVAAGGQYSKKIAFKGNTITGYMFFRDQLEKVKEALTK